MVLREKLCLFSSDFELTVTDLSFIMQIGCGSFTRKPVKETVVSFGKRSVIFLYNGTDDDVLF